MTMEDERKTHGDRFAAAVRGIPGHHVTKAMNQLTPGHLWDGSSKTRMARARQTGDREWHQTL